MADEKSPQNAVPNNTASAPPAAGETVPTFHDIKPLPQFSPFPWNLLFSALGILLGALLVILWRRRRNNPAPAPVVPPLSPLESVLAEYARLEQLRRSGQISLRDLSSRLSVATRLFFERTLNFTAAEQTTAELTAAMPGALRQALPTLPQELRTELAAEARKLLRFLEQLAFSTESSERFHLDSDELLLATKQLEKYVRELDGHFKREAERTRSVMETGVAS